MTSTDKSAAVRIDFKQATDLLAMFGGEPSEITLQVTTGHSGKGLYAHYTDLPEEGCTYLGVTDEEAVPDATPADPGAVAVAYANPVILLPNDEGAEQEWSARVQSHRDDVFSLALYTAPSVPSAPAAEVAAQQCEGPPAGYLPIPEDEQERRYFDLATKTYGGDVRANINLTLRQFAAQRPGGSFAATLNIIANEVLKLHRFPPGTPAAEVAQPVMALLNHARFFVHEYTLKNTRWTDSSGVKQDPNGANALLAKIDELLASSPSSAPAESGWQWVSIIRESVRRAEASHSAMSYGDEKSGAVSDYTRGWGDCLVIFKQAASRLPAESAWQWVPKELTPAMIEAAMQVKRERLKEALQQIRAGKDETEARTPVIKGEWDAMLAVAPQAVQAGGEGGNG